ncbi:MAG: penicillin-binding protein, partial [Bacteroidaceae bacterium]|nr:penicillin-binding protein [Bacteroidaceae bacterium]
GWEQQQYVDDSTAWENNPAYGWCEKNRKPDGSKYNIYSDGLKIYTGIDSRMQQYAEEAVKEHIADYLQPRFFAEKKGRSYAPFARTVTPEQRKLILERSMKNSDRYRAMKKAGASQAEIEKAFNTPVETELFSYNGTIDTIITPMDSIRYVKTFLRTGFVVMDPLNGKVKAYVGGPNFSQFQYDMAGVGRRQIGSTIKPFLYTLAMEEGFTPNTTFLNEQPTFILPSGDVWEPRNAGTARIGEMVPLSWALSTSNNWISARLIDQLSPESLVRIMRSFGITNRIDAVLSLCLGPVEVSVEEMVSAYTAFANNGVRIDPIYVTRIEDNHGNVIAEFTPQLTDVFSERAYSRIVPILQSVIDGGTGSRIRYRYNITAPMGGKTGTTNDMADGWFMSFTPNLVTGTWVGGEDRDIHFDYMSDGQGASIALPVAGLFYQKVFADKSLQNEGYVQTLDFEYPKYEESNTDEVVIATTPEENVEESIEGIFE